MPCKRVLRALGLRKRCVQRGQQPVSSTGWWRLRPVRGLVWRLLVLGVGLGAVRLRPEDRRSGLWLLVARNGHQDSTVFRNRGQLRCISGASTGVSGTLRRISRVAGWTWQGC